MGRRDEILNELVNDSEATDIISVEFTLLWEELQQLERDMYPNANENTKNKQKGGVINGKKSRKQNRCNKNGGERTGDIRK